MRPWLPTFVQAGLLLVVACALGLAANRVRGDKNHLDLSRNYFPKVKVEMPQRTAPGESVPAADHTGTVDTHSVTDDLGNGSSLGDHGLQVMDFEDALAMYNDDMYGSGMCVFVDARDEELYRRGHVPGAYQYDHYRAADHLPDLLPIALGADRVVLYCASEHCEDSLFAANDLLEGGVGLEVIHLYEGGFSEWERNNAPIARGDAP